MFEWVNFCFASMHVILRRLKWWKIKQNKSIQLSHECKSQLQTTQNGYVKKKPDCL